MYGLLSAAYGRCLCISCFTRLRATPETMTGAARPPQQQTLGAGSERAHVWNRLSEAADAQVAYLTMQGRPLGHSSGHCQEEPAPRTTHVRKCLLWRPLPVRLQSVCILSEMMKAAERPAAGTLHSAGGGLLISRFTCSASFTIHAPKENQVWNMPSSCSCLFLQTAFVALQKFVGRPLQEIR